MVSAWREGERIRWLVTFSPIFWPCSLSNVSTDFLAVRKIPLKERPYLVDETESSQVIPDPDPSPSGSRVAQDKRLRGCAVEHMLAKIRAVVLEDRDIHDKVRRQALKFEFSLMVGLVQAVKAYVSFIRAYTKHEASYIFRLKDLDLVGVAQSFGLLRLPRCPELKGADREAAGWRDEDVEVSSRVLCESFACPHSTRNFPSVGYLQI